MSGKRGRSADQRVRQLQQEVGRAVAAHPLLTRLPGQLEWRDLPHMVSVRVVNAARVELNQNRRYSIAQWLWWIGHARLHIAFGHPWDMPRASEIPAAFSLARCLQVNDLLFQLGIGDPPTVGDRPLVREPLPERDLDALVQHLQARGMGGKLLAVGGVQGQSDIVGTPPSYTPEQLQSPWGRPCTRETCAADFAAAIRSTLEDAIDRVAGMAVDDRGRPQRGPAALATRWIRSQLPVIGALLDRYRVIEDAELCRRLDIHVAAVFDDNQEILLNPGVLSDEQEYRFVIAHELLHAGLRHADRCAGRQHVWWNAACDFVINLWLIEMGVGRPPAIGGLYDSGLQGLSAEQVYDRIHATLRENDLEGFAAGGDLRQNRPLPPADWADLDSWCRHTLLDGLELHQERGRGTLPAGLVEEIRALTQPPIPWDVELARWFEREVGTQPLRRSYARPSRRQASTPDIPRPRWVPDEETEYQVTFATVIDTSGSMDRVLLGKALGAVASYAIARQVRWVRVVFCDAAAHDGGWIAPEQLLERVAVRGRGGTILQPGIDLIEQDRDFPPRGPMLIITDGQCDRFVCRRPHAILTPSGARLPFIPTGEVFRMT